MAKKAVTRNASATKSGTQGKAKGFKAKAEDVDSAWGESRKVEPSKGGGDFTVADVPDDTYILQLTSAKISEYKKGDRKGMKFYSFSFTIKFGDYAGANLNKKQDVDAEKKIKIKDVMYSPLDLLSQDLQRLGIDVKKMKSPIKDGPAVCDALKKSQPVIRGYVTTKPNTKNPSGQPFQSVYLNELVTDEELDQIRETMGPGVGDEGYQGDE